MRVKKAVSVALIVLMAFFTQLSQHVPAAEASPPKYIFLFIGDGMGPNQVTISEVYAAREMLFSGLSQQGSLKTNSLNGITDSAAAGTAIATGQKVLNGSIAMLEGKKLKSIAKIAQEKGRKVGIITTAFLQDATPAAFYGNVEKRSLTYDLGVQLTKSGFDLFAGGGFRKPKGPKQANEDLRELARKAGYTVTETRADFEALTPGTKAIGISPTLTSGSMPFVINRGKDDITLPMVTNKAINLLDCDAGFFIMIEGGMIDIACHANDLKSLTQEVLEFDEAVGVALKWREAEPEETLIVVTADHETGGLDISGNKDSFAFLRRTLDGRPGSYHAFERTIVPGKESLQSLRGRAEKFFGSKLVENDALRAAYKMSMTRKDKRPVKDKGYIKRYSTYDPFTTVSMKQSDALLGIVFNSFLHTGVNVPVYATGVCSELFAGEHENTDIFDLLKKIMEL